MSITYVNKKKQKMIVSSDKTSYVLPFSGAVYITEVRSTFFYVNGEALKPEEGRAIIDIEDASLELEVDSEHYSICVLCTPWSETLMLDYNAFGKNYQNNLIDGVIDSEMLFMAIEGADMNELHIPLCTFSRSYENITNREFDIDKVLDYVQQLMHVFYKPKQHLKQVNEIRPASVASRTGQESIRYLASHSEHWKGIKANGLIPERLLARVLEDDNAIYENIAAKTLVDTLLKRASKLRLETMDCELQINMDDSHSVSSEQKNYFQAKNALLKGLDDEDIYITQELLAEQTIKLSDIIDLLGDCKSTQLYRELRRQPPIRGKLKQTNIFMKDKHYKYVYKLWNLLDGSTKVDSEDITKPIEQEYSIFCRILLLFAIRYFNFQQTEENGDVLQNDKFKESSYSFSGWKLNVREADKSAGEDAFEVEILKNNEVLVDLSQFDIAENALNGVLPGVRFAEGKLFSSRALNDKEQELLVSESKKCWSKSRQKSNASEMKQKLYATFFNYSNDSRKILFVPWKYCLPDNVEQIGETLDAIKQSFDMRGYDECYILTISRPNELNSVNDYGVIQNLLFYGNANETKGNVKNSIGVIPVGLSDINSYRRYTKILLKHMVDIDHEREACPLCGQKLYRKGNAYECRNNDCQLELLETKCPRCKEKYFFSRYPLSKLVQTRKVDSVGFNMLYDENKLGFKNITDAVLEGEKLIPICPHCGYNKLE